jgi:hypothetical protein
MEFMTGFRLRFCNTAIKMIHGISTDTTLHSATGGAQAQPTVSALILQHRNIRHHKVQSLTSGHKPKMSGGKIPNGVPAVSDEPNRLMEYIHEQQPRPTNTIGVPVT